MTTGATSSGKIVHESGLFEDHAIHVPIAAFGGDEDAAYDVARLTAQGWLRGHGLEADIEADPAAPDGHVGVCFELTIGTAQIEHAPTRPAPRWTWSARALHWAETLSALRPSRAAARRMTPAGRDSAEVIEFPRGMPVLMDPPSEPLPADHPSMNVPRGGISFPPDAEPDQRPPWLRRADGWDEDDAGEGVPPGLLP